VAPRQSAEVIAESSRIKSLLLEIAGWQGHLPRRHVEVRQQIPAHRSYSIVSPPEDGFISLTVERVENGEVSHYLVDELRCGDRFELRGAVRGLLRVHSGRGSSCLLHRSRNGLGALMAMLRHRQKRTARAPATLLYSFKNVESVIYRSELAAMTRRDCGLCVIGTPTRKQPMGWMGYSRRVDGSMLADVCLPPDRTSKICVCSPPSFVEHVSALFVELGHTAHTTKTERFGPTSGERQ
jgi:ferredoxin-NADP reductase